MFEGQQGSAVKFHFVRSIRGLQNFLTIPIMNSLAGFMIQLPIQYIALYRLEARNKTYIKPFYQ